MALWCPWITRSRKLLAVAIRVEVSNRKKELQGKCDVMVGFIGWTSTPGTFVESENKLEDLQSFTPLGLSVVLTGTKRNA